ncbi:hypothetical protein ACR31S_03955 [Streptococcus iniae]
MLQVKNLKITHKNDLKSLINNLSISLNDAGKLAIIGEEGTGKSNTLKIPCRSISYRGLLQFSWRVDFRF